CQLGYVDDAKYYARNCHQPEQHDASLRLDIGHPNNKLFDPKEELTGGNGSFRPHLVGTQLEVVREGGNPILVGIHSLNHESALPDVGVDVPTEQRDSEHHGQSPGHHSLQGGLAGLESPDPNTLPQAQPSPDKQHATNSQQDDGQRDAHTF